MDIRKLYTIVEETHREAGRPVERPITRVAAVAVVANPLANRPGEDVGPLIEYGTQLGRLLSERVLAVLPRERIESFGKSAVVGHAGEIEHAAALLHPTYGKSVRAVIGGGKAAIPSTKKMGGPGPVVVDVPLCYKEAQKVVTHYDSMPVHLPDGPHDDEVAVILVCTDGGRPHARIPGLRIEGVKGEDGLV